MPEVLTDTYFFIAIVILINVYSCNCVDISNERRCVGRHIWVEFIPGINESHALQIIESYNLTFAGYDIYNDEPIVIAEVKVPLGKETYYAGLLKKDSNISDAGVYWED